MAQVLSASAFAMPPGSAWLVSSWMNVGLVSLRVAVVLALTPVLRSMTMPVAVRLLLVLAMSLSLSLVLAGTMATAKPAPTPPLPLAASGTPPAAALLQAALCELAIGATLALGILLAFAAFSVAGNLLDVQIGFGIGQVVDAASAHPLPIVAALFNQTAMLVFFLVDGHHGLLRGLAWSLLHFPAGAPWSLAQMDRLLLGQAAGLFSLGFALAAPVAFCLLLLDLALGIVARNLPQMNLFAVGIPLKILIGLLALAAWFAGVGTVMERVYGTIYQGWNQLFALAPVTPADPGHMLAPLREGP